ncbi:troponin T, cardiac muscle isoform X2 [Mycetomoellerius zeteki]|uniref:troponin T, cardiac muscle isoform X2 n=1 Tax=Mycetomoellerius zeteki TaxID=64791 RepID=UPI00084E4409|nr:PREDICTED: troponin T, cardiac muscle-like isoform X2 [Trachymyrmex zeteki]
MTEQMTENDAGEFVDEDNGKRLYLNTVVSDDRENSASENEEYKDERIEEEEEEKEDIYKMDEFFIWDQEPGEHEYEEEGYEERSLEDEEAEEEGDAPSEDIATISTAEKLEEEVQQDVVGPDHVLAEIPVEIFASREAMLNKLKELLAEQVELRRKNRLLESWIIAHMRKMQEKVTPVDTTKESEQMEQIYRQTLHTYKQYLDDVTERKKRIAADMESYEDRVQKTRDENARVFDELLDREREVATGLIYGKTGRMLTEKAVNEITRRQVSRREILARNRYEYILLQHHLEEIKMQLRNLETLGEEMTAMDYEALHIAHVNYKDKLDERDRELEKWRNKIAEMVNGVAHYKEKETCLAEDIEFEERELNEYCEQTARVREDVNKLHLILRDLRWAHDEKRLEGGLLMAPPVLRETERKMKLLDAVRNDIEIIKREIHRYGPANGRKKTSSEALAMSTMTQEKPDRF